VEEQIGRGNFSVCYRAWDQNESVHRCLKIETDCTLQKLMDQVIIHRRLKNADTKGELFPRLLDYFYAHERWMFVEECLEGKDLWQVVEADPAAFKPPSRVRCLARSMLRSLDALHQAQVIHCDIKPDNIMLLAPAGNKAETSVIPPSHRSDDEASTAGGTDGSGYKLLDFGCSRLDNVDHLFALKENGAGHVGHASPEMLLRQETTCKNDVWALGVTLCELVAAKLLWVHGDNEAEVLAKIIGLLGMSDGLPFSAYETAGFDINLHMHPSGFPIRHSEHSDELEVLRATALPNATSIASDCNTSCSASKDALKYFLGTEDALLVDFISCLLVIDPRKRPTPKQALKHSFLWDTSD